MTEIPLEIFLQSMIHPLKINVGWILASLGSNWIRFGNNIPAEQKDFGAYSICKASDAEHVKILVGSIFGGMEIDLILIGRAMDCSNQI